jgi:hypothetical protein
MGLIEELGKRWRARLSAFFTILALIVLLDELVKEGYAIDPHDFLAWPPFAHEQLFLLFLALALLFGLRR